MNIQVNNEIHEFLTLLLHADVKFCGPELRVLAFTGQRSGL
jgi:hypothetical protein